MRMTLKLCGFFACMALIFSSCQKEAASFIDSPNLIAPSVDAGPSKSVTAGNVSLTGTATSANGPIVGYLWSLVSGPNVPVIQSPGSATTTISMLANGNYLFQLMAIDSAGLTGVDTVSVKVSLIPVIQTLSLQPANNQTEFDYAAYSGGGELGVHGLGLDASAWTISGQTYYIRGAVKFDLSTIPSAATILSAKLTLYSTPDPINGNHVDANAGTANAMTISRILSSWSPNTATWANQPPTTSTDQVFVPHTDLPDLDLVDLDVKNMVTAMQTNGNYGFKLQLTNEVIYNVRQFCSSIYQDATKYPKLVVVYQQ